MCRAVPCFLWQRQSLGHNRGKRKDEGALHLHGYMHTADNMTALQRHPHRNSMQTTAYCMGLQRKSQCNTHGNSKQAMLAAVLVDKRCTAQRLSRRVIVWLVAPSHVLACHGCASALDLTLHMERQCKPNAA